MYVAHVWSETPPAVIANSFRHSGFVHPDDSDIPPEATPEDTREPTGNVDDEVNDTRFDSVLPSGVQILDYVAIDYHVVVAGPLTDDDILSEVLEEDQNHCSDDDGQDEPPTRRRRTVQEAAEALAVLEEFYVCSRDSERAHHHLMGLNKILLSEIPTARQTKITHFFKK
ncbi:hypothetical protein HPB49_013571 [Dermacentor silvarum]|uniref:Uncharacterized protein n=1 Tax=Dermacentor silvarum TaxID=543639 RepID=A0ACB8E0M8_DERSI|nr:hypothetical protein HPB49_013571 [Dermacentor silvarum]